MHKATLTGNPVRQYRVQLQQTMQEFAANCHIGYAALCVVEGACYESVPPAVVSYLKVRIPELDLARLQAEYGLFQANLRKSNFEHVTLSLPDPDLTRNPIRHFRKHLQLGYAEFYKLICLNPGVLYRVENDKYRKLPSQMEDAFQDVGMAKDDIEELDFRVTERYENVLRRKRRAGRSGK